MFILVLVSDREFFNLGTFHTKKDAQHCMYVHFNRIISKFDIDSESDSYSDIDIAWIRLNSNSDSYIDFEIFRISIPESNPPKVFALISAYERELALLGVFADESAAQKVMNDDFLNVCGDPKNKKNFSDNYIDEIAAWVKTGPHSYQDWEIFEISNLDFMKKVPQLCGTLNRA